MHAKQVALVTGANKGLGLEIARLLGRKGLTVVIGARDEARGADAAKLLRDEGLDVQNVRLDVTDPKTIAALPQHFETKYGRLDVLVNNAGVLIAGDVVPSQTPVSAMRETFETNVFGLVELTQALLPLLRKSPAARIVNMSSGLGSLTQLSDPQNPFYSMNALAYNASKTALNAFTLSLAKELKETAIKVNSADPGWCRTDMGSQNAPLSAEEGADTPAWLATLPDDGPTGGYYSARKTIPW